MDVQEVLTRMGEDQPIRVVIAIKPTDVEDMYRADVSIVAGDDEHSIGVSFGADYGTAHAGAAAIATAVLNRYGIAGRFLGGGGVIVAED